MRLLLELRVTMWLVLGCIGNERSEVAEGTYVHIDNSATVLVCDVSLSGIRCILAQVLRYVAICYHPIHTRHSSQHLVCTVVSGNHPV